MARVSVVFPLPVGPRISLNRPRGSPPPTSTASNAATPVGNAGVGGGGGGRSLTSSAIDSDIREGRGRYRAGYRRNTENDGRSFGRLGIAAESAAGGSIYRTKAESAS